MRSRPRLLLLVFFALGAIDAAHAMEELNVEESIADLLPQRPPQEGEEETAETRKWALLPEIGYGPETGPLGGAKFTHRSLFDTGVTLDLEATYSARQQEVLSVEVAQPFMDDGHYLIDFGFSYRTDPQRYFFGLGNNVQGPDPASTNSFQDIKGYLTFGWRPTQQLALNVSVGARNVHVGPGDQLNHCGANAPCPRTQDLFPDLTGVDGGTVAPVSLSLVWNDRDDYLRPTHGWRGIVKVIYSSKLLGDFAYARFIADLGYVRTFFDGRFGIGARADGEYVQGAANQIPYWSLAELGGNDTMRGFYPHRFLGKARALVNGEAKFLITEFDFFDLWHVKVDGVVFGDTGRVFLSSSQALNEFNVDQQAISPIVTKLRYSYGGGVRFALGEALLARIDVGFSEEEKGLVYLSFGQTF